MSSKAHNWLDVMPALLPMRVNKVKVTGRNSCTAMALTKRSTMASDARRAA